MNWRTVFASGALALGALLVLRVAVSVTLSILGLLWAIIMTTVTLLAIGGLLYGGYKLFSWAQGSQSSPASDSSGGQTSTADRVERLKERYARGDLSEDEFERRLDRELGGPNMDSLNRERTRERE